MTRYMAIRPERWRDHHFTGQHRQDCRRDTSAHTHPLERLRILVRAFIRSECEEAAMRVALNDATSLYRDVPEAKEAKAAGQRRFQSFMREALRTATGKTRAVAGNLITTTLGTVGKDFSESPRTPAEIKAYAKAMSDMFCAYLEALNKGT